MTETARFIYQKTKTKRDHQFPTFYLRFWLSSKVKRIGIQKTMFIFTSMESLHEARGNHFLEVYFFIPLSYFKLHFCKYLGHPNVPTFATQKALNETYFPVPVRDLHFPVQCTEKDDEIEWSQDPNTEGIVRKSNEN